MRPPLAGASEKSSARQPGTNFNTRQPGIMKGRIRMTPPCQSPSACANEWFWMDTWQRVSPQYPSIVQARMCMFGPSSPSIRPTSPVQASIPVNCQDACASRHVWSHPAPDPVIFMLLKIEHMLLTHANTMANGSSGLQAEADLSTFRITG